VKKENRKRIVVEKLKKLKKYSNKMGLKRSGTTQTTNEGK